MTYAKSEKSKGALIFASNTNETDYSMIAGRSARLIERHLGIPTTVVEKKSQSTNQRYSTEHTRFVEWNNKGRFSAFDESPYDVTLLIDADYLVFDDRLSMVMNTVSDYAIMRNNIFLPSNVVGDRLGEYSFETSWATVVVFEKTEKARLLFDMVGRVQDHYSYYRSLYNISHTNYRNDYAFTIADRMLNGYCEDSRTQIPWIMTTLQGSINDIELQPNGMIVRFDETALVLPRQDVHVLGKKFLQSDRFGEIVEAACA